jgi:nucleoid-associated protein YgaU
MSRRHLRSLVVAACFFAAPAADWALGATGDDSSNPHFQQAQQDLDAGNPTAAVQEYEAVLAANPRSATAEYQLGMLEGEKLHDAISSIYHLREFLAISPNSDKAPNAKAMIEKQGHAFAASLPKSLTTDTASRLQADNAALRKQVDDASHTIAQLQAQLAQRDAAVASPPPAPVAAAEPATGPAPTPAGPQRALPLDATNVVATATAPGAPVTPGAPAIDTANARRYTVVKGDSIWKIAHKMYPGDTKNGVDKIQEANKDALGSKPLKIGQVLLIP